jgi:hypothetical protein
MYTMNNLTNQLLVDHISIVSDKDILVNHTSDSKHGKTSVVEFLVLVHNPAFITVIDPIGGSEEVTRVVSWSGLDLFGKPFNSYAFRGIL